jgi:hypothetical protein
MMLPRVFGQEIQSKSILRSNTESSLKALLASRSVMNLQERKSEWRVQHKKKGSNLYIYWFFAYCNTAAKVK